MELTFATKAQWSRSRQKPPSQQLSAYATAQEIADLRAKLITRFKHIGGESAEDVRFNRSVIRQALEKIYKGQIPSLSDSATEDLLAAIRARYEEAKNAQTPVDDEECWARELARRAELQARYANEFKHTKGNAHNEQA